MRPSRRLYDSLRYVSQFYISLFGADTYICLCNSRLILLFRFYSLQLLCSANASLSNCFAQQMLRSAIALPSVLLIGSLSFSFATSNQSYSFALTFLLRNIPIPLCNTVTQYSYSFSLCHKTFNHILYYYILSSMAYILTSPFVMSVPH